ANDYVKNKLGDNSSDIQLSTDGIDLTNADVGEKVGDVITPQDRKFRREHQGKYRYIQMDFDRTLNGVAGLTGSTFRGGAAYGLIKTGGTLLFVPEPTMGTKIVGGILVIGGVVAAIFTVSDAVESGQDVYYGVTNQRDKKSINFGREFLGEDTYDTLDMLSVAGAPMLYQYGDYRIVMAEGEAAQRALATNMANQNQVSNVIVDTNKSLNIKQQEGQNSQQGQRSQDNAIQNNKNSINKTQAQGNQDYYDNQQVSKGSASNNQQGAPVKKLNTEPINNEDTYTKEGTYIHNVIAGNKKFPLNQPKNLYYQTVRNETQIIDGMEFSGHALDRMQDRGIPISVVKEAIQYGEKINDGTRFKFYDSKNNISVVVEKNNGRIVTVEYGGKKK
ncbi:DUF4258 domain-containing protein, partial [Fusobacterium nucleatum]